MTTKECFYCGDTLTEHHLLLDVATMIGPQRYAHFDCIISQGKENAMNRKCLYCGEHLVAPEFDTGLAIKTGRDRYAHIACINSHEGGKCVDESAQHILGAADSAHQGIDLAKSLLQESLGNMGEILTAGCTELGKASLGSAMCLGQRSKEILFMLDDLLNDAQGLCVLLGHDLGVCNDEVTILNPGPGRPSDTEECPPEVLGEPSIDWKAGRWRGREKLIAARPGYADDFPVGKDEFDDAEQPF